MTTLRISAHVAVLSYRNVSETSILVEIYWTGPFDVGLGNTRRLLRRQSVL